MMMMKGHFIPKLLPEHSAHSHRDIHKADQLQYPNYKMVDKNTKINYKFQITKPLRRYSLRVF